MPSMLMQAGANRHDVDVIGWGVLHHAANGGNHCCKAFCSWSVQIRSI